MMQTCVTALFAATGLINSIANEAVIPASTPDQLQVGSLDSASEEAESDCGCEPGASANESWADYFVRALLRKLKQVSSGLPSSTGGPWCELVTHPSECAMNL
jgi:hypothetical protein